MATHTQPKKGDTNRHLPTLSQKRSYPPMLAVNLWERKFFVIHQLIKFIRNSRSLKYNFCKVQCQAIGISISAQYWTNDKQVSCCHKQFQAYTYKKLLTIYIPSFTLSLHLFLHYSILFFSYLKKITYHLSTIFHSFTSLVLTLQHSVFFLLYLLLCIIFDATSTSL